jgi:hypothetical protein
MIFKLFKADKAGLCDVATENGFGADRGGGGCSLGKSVKGRFPYIDSFDDTLIYLYVENDFAADGGNVP